MDRGVEIAVDANINRAMEGIRVCEDIFRFCIKNNISSEFKKMRHNLLTAASGVFGNSLIASRAVISDSQKFIDTVSEKKRAGYEDLFRSNIRRACEALRVIEEFSKTGNLSGTNNFQGIRFALYDLEQKGWALIRKQSIIGEFDYSLYGILDTAFVPLNMMTINAEIMASEGCGIIQLRMKSHSSRELLEASLSVAEICRENKVLFIVNDRPDIAVLCSASGVHLGQDDISPDYAAEIIKKDMITGLSVHNIDEVKRALNTSANYIAFGPVFDTTGKNGELLKGGGTDLLGKACIESHCPVVAIGGITPDNTDEIIDAGCSCIAVISALFQNNDLAGNVKKLAGKIKSRRI
jgi:thiamine-phosphate pyrophosphorylase